MSGSSVTIPGVSATPITLSFVGSANLGLAHQISNALAAASGSGTLDVVDYSGGALPSIPGGDTTLELVLNSAVSGSITVPAAASGISEVLIVNNTQALTINGSANLSIVGGGPGALTINDPNVVDIGSGIGTAGTVSMSFTAADSPYQVAMGQGFETVNAAGSGTITGGTGPNVINVSGPNDNIEAGSDGTTVNATGFASSIDGSAGNLTVTDAGFMDTITGGALFATAVTTSGFRADVIGSSDAVSFLTDVDTGFRNTVQAGAGAAAVTLAGFDGRVFGGSGAMSVLDEGINSTISASTGDTSVTTGGTNALVFGGSGLLNVNAAGGTGVVVDFGTGGGVFSSSTASSGAEVFAGAGTVSVNAGQTTNDTIIGGTGAITVNAGSASNLLVFGPLSGSPGLDFIGGSGVATVVGQAGADTIGAGTASLDVFLTPNETLSASSGGGTPTIFGNSNVDVNYTGSAGSLLFVGFTGNETLNAAGSSSNNTYFGGIDSTAGNSIIGGSGNDLFVAGAGTDTLTGGAGSSTFEFIGANLAGSAQTDVITNFLSGSNNLAAFFGVSTVSSSTTGAATTLTLSDNTKVTFVGVSDVDQLSGHIFIGS